MEIRLAKTQKVVTDCWDSAERDLQQQVGDTLPDADEELLTREFHSRFAACLKIASQKKLIEDAFFHDLEGGLRNSLEPIDVDALRNTANGLIADAILHHKGTEKKTGGDLGLVLSRPFVSQTSRYDDHIVIESRHSGLLVQAKLAGADGLWGELTPNQKIVLPSKLQFSGLLLYEYSDDKRRTLKPFAWQSLRPVKRIATVVKWLATGKFPSVVSSGQMINALSSGEVGTTDGSLIEKYIAPVGNTWLEVRIDWPGKGPPNSKVYVHSRYENENVQRVWA